MHKEKKENSFYSKPFISIIIQSSIVSSVQVVTAKHFSLSGLNSAKFRIDHCKSNIKDIVFKIQNLSLLHDYS